MVADHKILKKKHCVQSIRVRQSVKYVHFVKGESGRIKTYSKYTINPETSGARIRKPTKTYQFRRISGGRAFTAND